MPWSSEITWATTTKNPTSNRKEAAEQASVLPRELVAPLCHALSQRPCGGSKSGAAEPAITHNVLEISKACGREENDCGLILRMASTCQMLDVELLLLCQWARTLVLPPITSVQEGDILLHHSEHGRWVLAAQMCPCPCPASVQPCWAPLKRRRDVRLSSSL